jgi:hypothetical protein
MDVVLREALHLLLVAADRATEDAKNEKELPCEGLFRAAHAVGGVH